jgi:hypothetical protein
VSLLYLGDFAALGSSVVKFGLENLDFSNLDPPHLRTETIPAFGTLCFLVSRIPDYGQSPKTQ